MTKNQKYRFFGELLWAVFSYTLVAYIVFFLLDDFFPGFVSRVLNVNIFLVVIAVSLFFLIPLWQEDHGKAQRVSVRSSFVLSLLGGLFLFGRLWGVGWLALPLAVLGFGVLFVSLRVLATENGDVEEKKEAR